MTKFVLQLQSVICRKAKQQPEGFTYDPNANSCPNRGYVVATQETQNCLGAHGLYKVIKYYLSHRDHCIGGWCNEDGIMQYDVSKIYDNLNEAILKAIENEQRAIFNLYTNQVIMASDYNNYLVDNRLAA